MNNQDIKKISLLTTIVAIALVMTISPLGLISGNNLAFAGGGGDHHDDDNDGNSAEQIISQVQKSTQNSQVVSDGDVEDSGNNFSFQNQNNEGNNAVGQQ